MFRFAHPLALLLLLIPVLMAALWYWRVWQPPLAVMRYSDLRLLAATTISWRVRLRYMPDVLRLLAWLLLVVALARPQTGNAQEIIRGQGIDIVLALDISGSMETLDFNPQTRLEAARVVIDDFIAGREFDRIGLVVFAADSYHYVPPTLDYALLRSLLQSVQSAAVLGLEDGTAIGMGLMSSANMLRTSSASSKTVILLTDGANNAGAIPPLTAAESLDLLGIRVYTIGMGRVTGTGQDVTSSDLDEATLRAIAETTDGLYFRATDADNLREIYDRIDALERTEIERQVFVQWQDNAFGWLIAGLVLLLLERGLRVTVFQTLP